MLVANIASTSKKFIAFTNFRNRVNLEEQKAQMQDRFLRGRQIAKKIYEYFRITGAVSLYKVTMFKILMPYGTKLNYQQVKCPETMFWKVCTRCERECVSNFRQCQQCTHKKSIKIDRVRVIRS